MKTLFSEIERTFVATTELLLYHKAQFADHMIYGIISAYLFACVFIRSFKSKSCGHILVKFIYDKLHEHDACPRKGPQDSKNFHTRNHDLTAPSVIARTTIFDTVTCHL